MDRASFPSQASSDSCSNASLAVPSVTLPTPTLANASSTTLKHREEEQLHAPSSVLSPHHPHLVLPHKHKKLPSSREHQRYSSTGLRLLVGCAPFRWRDEHLEVLLVASQKGDEWILPKGGWESHESAEEGAARETREEAGVLGRTGVHLGEYSDTSKKSPHIVSFFALEVKEELTFYAENTRPRRWFSIHDALRECSRLSMQNALVCLMKHYGFDKSGVVMTASG